MNRPYIKPTIALISGLSLLTTLLYWTLWPAYDSFLVTKFGWERSIRIEQLNTVQRTSTYAPPDARIISTWLDSRIVHDEEGHTRVKFERKYRYELEEWQHYITHVSNNEDRKPYWPKFSLQVGRPPYNAGQQRESRREEEYWVELKGKKRTSRAKVPFDQWQRLEVGQSVWASYNTFGHVYSVKELESGGN